MKSKPYTNASNCIRAAKKAIGPTAAKDVNFTIDKDGPTAFTWSPKGDAANAAASSAESAANKPKRGKAKKGTKSPVARQPQAIAALKLAAREEGVTVAAGSKALGQQPHSFRGLMSRLRNERGVTAGVAFKIVTYYYKPTAAERAEWGLDAGA